MTTQTINEIWNYYLTLEGDIANTSRFIEPSGQENVHSFEFAKILILACTELESVFKLLCLEITGKQPEGTIGKYKETILGRYPRIVDAVVSVKRWGRTIAPFEGWDIGKLSWWNAYQEVKHNRGEYFWVHHTIMLYMPYRHSIFQFFIWQGQQILILQIIPAIT